LSRICISHHSRDANPTRLSERLQTSSDIHPVAKDVVFLNDHVAEVDADPKSNALVPGHLGFALDHAALDLRDATHGVHNTRKLRQQAVAGILYGTAPVLLDLRIDQLPEMGLEPLMRPFLIRSHQTRIACHVGG
jgi:hypothetical protein